MTRILVTGATGGLGRDVVEALLDRISSEQVVALAREPSKLSDIAARGVDVRVGDYADPDGLMEAFAGIDKLLLISAPAFTDAVTQHANVIDAAKKAGVRHLHYTAIQHPSGSSFEIPQVTAWDRATELRLHASGLDVTILRNTLYVDTLPFLFGRDVAMRGIRVPAGQGQAALASRRDLAQGAAAVLAGRGHEGKAYTLSGNSSVGMADLALAVSKGLGQDVGYEDIPVLGYVADRMVEGFQKPFAEFAASWFQAIAAGEFAEASGDLQRLIGRLPQSPKEFLISAYRESTSATDA